MDVTTLGGAKQVGRSAFLVKSGKTKVLLDYGVLLARVPVFPMHVQPREVDAIFLTHAHLDHSGGIPIFYLKGGVPLYTTGLTAEITQLLIEDLLRISGFYIPYEYIDLTNMLRRTHKLELNREVKAGDFTGSFFEAGHLPGSGSILLQGNGQKLLYTGDLNAGGTQLLRSAVTDFEELDILITECTYASADHPPRERVEKEFVQFAKEVVERGGTLLVPAFSAGRAQEIACVLKAANFPYTVAMDGMALKVNEVLFRYPECLRDSRLFSRSIESLEIVTSWSERRRLVKTPSVIISPAGMLVGGAVLFYNNEVAKHSKNAISIVSFQIPGTPGRTLLERGLTLVDGKPKKVKCQVRQFDFSSHSGRGELLDMFKKLKGNPKVLTVHGEEDVCVSFSKELQRDYGLEASAPNTGETYHI
jgi:putative mRNA 3-end processing factor